MGTSADFLCPPPPFSPLLLCQLGSPLPSPSLQQRAATSQHTKEAEMPRWGLGSGRSLPQAAPGFPRPFPLHRDAPPRAGGNSKLLAPRSGQGQPRSPQAPAPARPRPCLKGP